MNNCDESQRYSQAIEEKLEELDERIDKRLVRMFERTRICRMSRQCAGGRRAVYRPATGAPRRPSCCIGPRKAGVSGLKSQGRGENVLKLSREQRRDLKRRVNEYQPNQVLPPEVRISRGAFWTMSDLEIVVERRYGVGYRSRGAYRLLLMECGFSYQRTEAV